MYLLFCVQCRIKVELLKITNEINYNTFAIRIAVYSAIWISSVFFNYCLKCNFFFFPELIPESVIRPWDAAVIPDVRLVGNLPFNVATPFLIR